jgi:hypothetical protein
MGFRKYKKKTFKNNKNVKKNKRFSQKKLYNLLGVQEDIFLLKKHPKFSKKYKGGYLAGKANINYIPLNKYPSDISRQMQPARGGGTKKNKKRIRRGGGFMQEISNFGQNAMFNLKSVSNTLNGNPSPVNPFPTEQNQIQNDYIKQ